MSNMHQIDVMNLTSKYDANELELRGGEYRNGFTVKNGVMECIGGPPTPLFLLLWHAYGAGEGYARRRAIWEFSVFCVATVDFGLPNTPLEPPWRRRYQISLPKAADRRSHSTRQCTCRRLTTQSKYQSNKTGQFEG